MAQSRPPLSILVGTQHLRIGGDAPPSAEGQDDYGMGGESSPESKCSFGMNGSPSPIAQHDFGMGGSLSPVARHDSRMGESPSPMAPDGHGMDSPLPTVARQHFGNPSAARVWEWGKCAPPSIASEVPGVAKSEVLQEVGDRGSFGMDGPPSPAAQDDFGMDLALPTEAREHVRIPSEAHTQEVETRDSFGMDAPPSPMAQDTFGMDSPISPRVHAQGTVPASSQQDGLPDEGIGADLALPTEAGEHCIRIPSAACTINWGGHALSPVDSQIQEGQVGESSEALQEVQVQHPPELVLEEEVSASTRAAILRAEASRLRRIHAQVWYVYEQEKEMSKVIDEMIDELDNAEVQNLV
ncbi:hypothetical protein EDB84DRAFT_1444513 [Lactarius hengduanensis]|nr:hypothetical protein EDB84DRAFT_1445277 [Lactarius hengduanensis]KAH9012876.1 hypothetical protein EDB84DRAFT_1444513 [Lactarius hengduanensis]